VAGRSGEGRRGEGRGGEARRGGGGRGEGEAGEREEARKNESQQTLQQQHGGNRLSAEPATLLLILLVIFLLRVFEGQFNKHPDSKPNAENLRPEAGALC
jgi:hypothetical protein